MTHIKKLVIHGFKSFANKTEIPFENAMNVVVGPNGSGKSNITDALCFALGRLSIKSIRAAKAANLLFSGNKYHKPAGEAFVELVFDNFDKTFAMDANEVSIKRIVRKNGLSIYKINNTVKTRQEIVELLAQAGIDPNGFNIVLQGEIASLIKINPEERRKIIEEVAGISIYESRKEKSLKEIEKTDEKLKEVSAVLRERIAYLKNLEREREEALNFQKLEETIKRCKLTIISKELKDKEKEIENLNKEIENLNKEIEKIKEQIKKKSQIVEELELKANQISKQIQSSTSNEQETLHKEISEFKAQIAGLKVRKENFENRIQSNKSKNVTFKDKIKTLEKEISEIKTSSPEIKKQQEKVKNYQEKLDSLEKDRRRFYFIKSELNTLQNKKSEKERFLIELKKEADMIEKNISSLFTEIKYVKSSEKGATLKQEISRNISEISEKLALFSKKELEMEKENAILSMEILKEEEIKKEILKLDICPLCKSKVTKEHINKVVAESDHKIEAAKKKQEQNEKEKIKTKNESEELKQKLESLKIKLNEIEIDIFKIRNADEKKEQIKRILENEKSSKSEAEEISLKIEVLRKEFEKLKNVEEEYDDMRLKLQEISFFDMDVDTEITIKQRELSRLSVEIKSISRDEEETEGELKSINERLKENEKILETKEIEEQKLYERFQKLFNEKNAIQDNQKAVETEIIGMQNILRNHEDKNNLFNIQKAKFNAEKESIEFGLKEFESLEPLQISFEQAKEKLSKSQMKISEIGSVNLRSLDIYNQVKEQCDQVQEKMSTIEKEKEKISKIIEEIDKKKKKSFLTTLDAVNGFFTRNFSQLSNKGEVFLDLENKKEPFAGGLNIIIKVAKGKYFDVTSLSGGEKTLIALSLIFAIQEYKPYCFYIFDEIDAALDKHNSEKLAALVKQYMTCGQYIIITHNDALISEASALYGVSMQENISKIISLKI
ncbi:MAG: chromosome segregation SMC family protein [Nanoarchaeota archaeon]